MKDLGNKVNKIYIKNKWYSKIIQFLTEAEFNKSGNYWWTWKDKLPKNAYTGYLIKIPLLEEFYEINPKSGKRKQAVRIDNFLLMKAINFWRENYETKWLKLKVEELKIYRCEYYNPHKNEIEYRPCVFKHLNNVTNDVMIFYFSSREKNETKFYAVKINEINSIKNPNSYFINTWTEVKSIDKLAIQDFHRKNEDVYLKKTTFYKILHSLNTALKVPHLKSGQLQHISKYQSVIRRWKRDYEKID